MMRWSSKHPWDGTPYPTSRAVLLIKSCRTTLETHPKDRRNKDATHKTARGAYPPEQSCVLCLCCVDPIIIDARLALP